MAEQGRREVVLLRGADSVLTGAGPLRGPIATWDALDLRRDAAVVVAGPAAAGDWPTLLWIGADGAADMPRCDRQVDLGGGLLLPGLVDPHTHAVFAGDRAAEWTARAAGASYQDIAAAGGGILHTVRATRAASVAELVVGLERRLDAMAAHGVRVVEVKTGYGLELGAELRCLDAIAEVQRRRRGRMVVVATAMPAHAVPPEFAGDAAAYVAHVCTELLPAMARHPSRPRFVDVFVEPGYFDVDAAAAVAAVAHALGLGLKAHVDEFERCGGLAWALAAGASSVEHLLASDDADLRALAASDTVAVGLPLVSLFLAQPFASLRALVDAGALVALGTDCNPGSSMSTNLVLAAQVAVLMAKLSPPEALRAITRGAARALGDPGGYDGTLRIGGPFIASWLDVPGPDALLYELGAAACGLDLDTACGFAANASWSSAAPWSNAAPRP